jgi:hypothetical protein
MENRQNKYENQKPIPPIFGEYDSPSISDEAKTTAFVEHFGCSSRLHTTS